MKVTIISVIWLWLFGLGLNQALILRCDKKTFNASTPGSEKELRIAVILTATKKNVSTNVCSTYQNPTIPEVLALQWIIDKLNTLCSREKLIPSYNIDFAIFDDCGEPEIAANHVYNIYRPFALNHNLCELETNQDAPYTAIISLSDYAVTQSILEKTKYLPITVVSPVIEQKAFKYKNFISLATPMETQVQAAIMLLKKMKWIYHGILYSDNEYGYEMANILETAAKSHNICFSIKKPFSVKVLNEIKNFQESFYSGMIYVGEMKDIGSFLENQKWCWIILDISGKIIQHNFKKLSNMTSLYVISSLNSNNKEFLDYLKSAQTLISSKHNDSLFHWIRNLFRTIKKIPSKYIFYNEHIGINIREIVESVYIIAMAKRKECKLDKCSTYLNAETLKSIITVNDQTVPNCFSKDRLGLKANTSDILHVYSYKEGIFKKVGDYFHNKTLILKSSEEDKTEILSTFKPVKEYSRICSENAPVYLDNILYIPGDIIILGVFSLHNTGYGFNCGSKRKSNNDDISGEAFLYSINKSKIIKDGIKLGALLMDDCYNPLRISLNITSILAGEINIMDSNTCQKISPSKIVGVIGSLSSSVTKAMADIFMLYKIPVISYAASSVDLDDRISYPYFLRTVPSDILQVKGIIEILKHFRWNYVGLIYADNNYGLKAKELLLASAMQNGICIYPFNPIAESEEKTNYNEFDEIFSTSLLKDITILIYFGTSSRTLDLLQSLENRKMDNYFTFIGSDAWGKNDLILNYGHVFMGSIITAIDNSRLVERNEELSFKNYLKNRLANLKYLKNTYFNYFWKEEYMCRLLGNAFPCRGKDLSNEAIDSYLNDHRIIQTMNSVYAIRNGIKKLIEEECDGNICNKFSTKVDELISIIKKTEISSYLDTAKMFDAHGNGLVGFQFYNLQKYGNKYIFKEVGSYNNNSGLVVDDKNIKFYTHDNKEIPKLETNCPKALECCKSKTNSEETHVLQNSSSIIQTIVIPFVVFLLFCLILGAALLYRKYKRGKMKIDPNETRLKTIYSSESQID